MIFSILFRCVSGASQPLRSLNALVGLDFLDSGHRGQIAVGTRRAAKDTLPDGDRLQVVFGKNFAGGCCRREAGEGGVNSDHEVQVERRNFIEV